MKVGRITAIAIIHGLIFDWLVSPLISAKFPV
jgi:hypothetical protein